MAKRDRRIEELEQVCAELQEELDAALYENHCLRSEIDELQRQSLEEE